MRATGQKDRRKKKRHGISVAFFPGAPVICFRFPGSPATAAFEHGHSAGF